MNQCCGLFEEASYFLFLLGEDKMAAACFKMEPHFWRDRNGISKHELYSKLQFLLYLIALCFPSCPPLPRSVPALSRAEQVVIMGGVFIPWFRLHIPAASLRIKVTARWVCSRLSAQVL